MCHAGRSCQLSSLHIRNVLLGGGLGRHFPHWMLYPKTRTHASSYLSRANRMVEPSPLGIELITLACYPSARPLRFPVTAIK